MVTLGPLADGELEAAGYERCALSLPADVDAWIEGVGGGRPLANRVLGAVAAGSVAPVGIVAARGWGLVAAGHGVPFVVVEPLTSAASLQPADPTGCMCAEPGMGSPSGASRMRLLQGIAGRCLARTTPMRLVGWLGCGTVIHDGVLAASCSPRPTGSVRVVLPELNQGLRHLCRVGDPQGRQDGR